MNKVNFDGLKNIKAPREWLEKAAAIPETCEKKHMVFPVRRIAASASIVLVSVIGLMVILFFGNGNKGAPVAVPQDQIPATEAFSNETHTGETRESGAPAETIAVYATNAQGNTVIDYREKPAATERKVSPTEKQPSSRAPIAPQSTAVPTAPRETENKAPSPRATEGKSSATDTPFPTVAPATEPPAPTDPPPIQIPTEGISTAEGDLCFSATFDASLLEDGEAVYCIYAPIGYAAGSSASSKKQPADYYITKNGTVYASCEVWIDEPLPAEETTTYQYIFVNERGHRLASGVQTM